MKKRQTEQSFGVGATHAIPRQDEMQARIAGLDWSRTPLGPSESWPQSLRTVVNILLSSRYAMWMAWGPELTMFYNDAYSPTLGLKHPWALGQPASQVWSEIWTDIGPRIETVLSSGKATYDEGLLLFLQRSGFPEETYHTFSYSPLADDKGKISGMLCVVTEETERLIGERRVATLRDVAAALASTNAEDEVLLALQEELSRNLKDLPFTLTYLFDESGAARLACWSGILLAHPLAARMIPEGADSPWPAHRVLTHPAPQIASLNEYQGGEAAPSGAWDKPVAQAAIVPIRQQGQETPAGFFVAGVNPHRRYDGAYSGFIDLLAGQIAAALGNARAYEAERRRAEALAEIDRAKTTFFSNVSHELRTPLTLMLAPVEELLSTGQGSGGEQRELLDLVHRNGLRLQRLVNTLLDFSRIEAGRIQAQYRPTDLAGLTRELASNFRSAMEKAGLKFEVHCEPLPQPVYIDREMWEKIVLNLLSNAFKFTFEGSVTVTLRPHGSDAELMVEDTGAGIPARDLPHIFERFHRVPESKGRSMEGTGIGLALVQELVKLHGGLVSAESEIGTGTRFTVRIPYGSEHLPQDQIRHTPDHGGSTSHADAFVSEALRWLPESTSVSGSTGVAAAPAPAARLERVLLADDNADMREYVTRLLSGRYDMTAVANGDDALQSALENPPDLILSDVMMPGLDGFALLQELRAHAATNTIPVVLLSARAGEEARVEGLDAGADDYLIKPFTARELQARVAAHLSMRRRRMEAEEALRESQATLQSFYDSSNFLMGVFEMEGDNLISLYHNAATRAFLGSELEGSHRAEELGVPEPAIDIWRKNCRLTKLQRRAVKFEYEHPKSGGARWLSCSVNYLGEVTGRSRFSFVAEDVTDRLKSERLLERSVEELRRANADLEQFAYSASHDLQEPLRQIAIYSELLDTKYASQLDGKASKYLGYCIEGAHRMESLIHDLLAYSQAGRASEAAAQPVKIDEVLATVKKNLSATIEETGAEIFIAAMPVVRGDPTPLVHLFQNLLSNALKYRSDRPPVIKITAEPEHEYWRFSVADNGIGMAKEFHEQVFGIFKRLHDRSEYPGTGIGLAICQKIAERSGGRIWLQSEPGQGSTFFFTLPRITGEK